MKNKKALSRWAWVLIAIIVIAIVVGAYFLFGSSGVPSPPPLPG